MRKLIQNRGAGDDGKFALGQHPEGGLTVKELNTLFVLGKILGVGSSVAGALSLQEFEYVIPAGSTTDKTFTSTVDNCSVLGGVWSIEGVDDDYDIDLGYTGKVTAFAADLVALIGSEVDGEGKILAEYIDNNEDVIITITSNDNTVPVTVYIALLTVKLVTT